MVTLVYRWLSAAVVWRRSSSAAFCWVL